MPWMHSQKLKLYASYFKVKAAKCSPGIGFMWEFYKAPPAQSALALRGCCCFSLEGLEFCYLFPPFWEHNIFGFRQAHPLDACSVMSLKVWSRAQKAQYTIGVGAATTDPALWRIKGLVVLLTKTLISCFEARIKQQNKKLTLMT